MYDWDDLRVFLALVRAGSLSAAARALGVEHTTVARRIEALERDLGVALFERLPRAWRPTDDGAAIAARAEAVEREALAVARAADAAETARPWRLRLSAPPVFASAFLTPRLAPFLAAHPDLRLDLVGETATVSLPRREADLALRLSRPTDPDLIARRLGHLRFALWAAPAHLAGRDPADWRWCGYDDALAHLPQERWLERRRGGRPLAFAANDLASLHAAAAAGIGVALLPEVFAAGDPRLVRLEDAPDEATREIWLALHPDLARAPRARLVVDALAAICAELREPTCC